VLTHFMARAQMVRYKLIGSRKMDENHSQEA